AEGILVGFEGAFDLLVDDTSTEREVTRGDGFGDADDVWFHAVEPRTEPLASAPEGCDNLVRDQRNVVFVEQRLQRRIEAAGEDDDTTRALHRLGDERGDGV